MSWVIHGFSAVHLATYLHGMYCFAKSSTLELSVHHAWFTSLALRISVQDASLIALLNPCTSACFQHHIRLFLCIGWAVSPAGTRPSITIWSDFPREARGWVRRVSIFDITRSRQDWSCPPYSCVGKLTCCHMLCVNWGEHQRAPQSGVELEICHSRYIGIYIYIYRRVVTFLWACAWRRAGRPRRMPQQRSAAAQRPA